MKIMLLGAAAWACVTMTSANAATYSAEYVFGDSLSDRGNLAETGLLQAAYGVPANTNFPNPPSNHDSFSNGAVAVQLLAQSVGLAADPSLFVTGFHDVHGLFGGASYVAGTNYAVAGATSALEPPVAGGVPGANLPNQIGAFAAKSGGAADPGALYVLFVGGNDVRNAALNGTGVPAVQLGVSTETAALQALATEGARKFLVVNVPDVGAIPEFAQDNPTLAANATLYSKDYDALLASGLAGLSLPAGTSVTRFDLFAYNMEILASIGAHAVGITNTTDRCFTATPILATATAACGPSGADIGSYYFWDSIHPTGQIQALWAAGFEQALAGERPFVAAPAPALAVLAGLGTLGLVRRKR